MHDHEIRSFLRDSLHKKYGGDPDTEVIDELTIGGGRSRIDLALVNGVLHGFELKSDYDTLRRLPEQVQIYGTVCDRVTLVVGERHAGQAVELIPEWWGILLVRSGHRRAIFRALKHPQINPSLDPLAIACLLRRSEAAAVIADLGFDEPGHRVSRQQLCEFIASNVELPLLCHRVRNCLRARQSVAKPRSYGG
jgi:hypothetical protein